MKSTGYAQTRFSEGSPVWKRWLDLCLGACLFVFLLVPMAFVGAAIFIESGWPVLIQQRRIGRHGDEYLMWKFRTLPRDTPQMAKSDLRTTGMTLTPFARRLRRYSVDELPQIINVLAGEMSLVGPRPALFTQHDLTEMRREAGVLRAKPGLTGLAQIEGREDLTLDEKVDLDRKYVERMSLLGDLAILGRTPFAVLRARGSF